MKRVIGKAGALAALLLLVQSFSGIAFAGQKNRDNGTCWNLTGTLQYCMGNMADIASQTADPTRYALFNKSFYNGVSTLQFLMLYNNNYYSCVAPPSMLETWNTLLTNRSQFFVEIDTTTGTCILAGANNISYTD